MKHLVLHSDQLNSVFEKETFSAFDLNELIKEDKNASLEKILKEINEKDLFPFRICNEIEKLVSHNSIIILKEGLRWDRLIRLATYIRLYSEDKWISNVPIFICCDSKPNPLIDKHLGNITEINNYLNLQGIFYKSFFEIFVKENNEEGVSDFRINVFFKTINTKIDISKIKIISENLINDRHSITNHWGAVKLAANAGYGVREISYNFPPTLYFKYLIRKFSIKPHAKEQKVTFNNYLEKKKILLVDDNYEKGWESVLKKIFGEKSIDSESYMMDISDQDRRGIRKLNKDLNIYDLIFLDLYLPEFQGQSPSLSNGMRLLRLIKNKHPEIPVIVFTASNKSWTRDSIINLGADGMYVKESPEYADDHKYSKENFRNFKKTVEYALEKYKVLRPYYVAINKTIESKLFKSLDEEKRSKFKERIEERLLMFYGLIKKGFEQTEYNRNQFHFSENELAFMTLWSILNEISEASYIKTQPETTIESIEGNKIRNHPGGEPIKYIGNHQKWQIKNQGSIFIEYEYDLNYIKGTHEPLNADKNGNWYKLNPSQKSRLVSNKNRRFDLKIKSQKTKVNYERTLYIQILYLLECHKGLSKCENKSIYKENLIRLNEIRNHLYLTHGSDVSSGFFDKTIKENRNNHKINPEGDIKDLFELISFLLTGEEIEIFKNDTNQNKSDYINTELERIKREMRNN